MLTRLGIVFLRMTNINKMNTGFLVDQNVGTGHPVLGHATNEEPAGDEFVASKLPFVPLQGACVETTDVNAGPVPPTWTIGPTD